MRDEYEPGVGEGGTNPGGELSDCKMPIRRVIEGECTLALHRGVCQGFLVNASRNPVNQQLAPLDVRPGSEGSRQLLERGLDGSGEDVGSIFELGDGRGRAPDNDQVALRGPPGGGDPDIGVVGSRDKGIIADRNQRGRGHTSLGTKVGGGGGVGKGNDETSPCGKPRGHSCSGVRSRLRRAFALRWRLGRLLPRPGACCPLSC